MTRLLGATLALGLAACVHNRQVTRPPPSALAAVEVDSSGVPFAPAPEGLLRPGAIEAIQGRLASKGFISGTQRTGRLDAATREALRQFQARTDLPATGLPSYRTIEALDLAANKIFFSARVPPDEARRTPSDQGTAANRTTP
jgi:peptidoglycan hydrolase-like protein with peptidoglycan-binding domain